MAFIETRTMTRTTGFYAYEIGDSWDEHDNYEEQRFPEVRDDGLTDDEYAALAYQEMDEEAERLAYEEDWRAQEEAEPDMPSFSGGSVFVRSTAISHHLTRQKDRYSFNLRRRHKGKRRAPKWQQFAGGRTKARLSGRTYPHICAMDTAYDSLQYLVDHFAAQAAKDKRDRDEDDADSFYSTQVPAGYENWQNW